MKKLLLSLGIALMAFATNAQTTIDWTTVSFTGVAEKSATITATDQGFTLTVDQNGGTTKPTKNGTYNDVRCYAGNKITLSSSSNMTSCVFNLSDQGLKRVSSGNTVNTGSLVVNVEAKTITWTGSATSFEITVGASADLGTDGASKAAQLDFNSTVISAGAATTVANPTFTPAAGTYYSAQTVTIDCATASAAIQYSTDGTNYQAYTAPVTVDKTMTLYAKATKDGLTASGVSQADYVISSVESVATIADFLAKNTTGTADKVPYKITGDVTVTYVGVSSSNHYLFVKDATGALQIFSKGEDFPVAYKNGDVISGIEGSVDFYGKAPQMVPELASFTAAKSNAPVAPLEVLVEDVVPTMVNQYILLKGVTVTVTDGKATTTTQNGTDLAIYNRFPSVVSPTETGVHDVAGIVSSYNDNLQLFPTDFDYVPSGVNNVENDANTTIVANYGNVEINAADANRAYVYNAAGQIVVNKVVAAGANTIDLNPGFYIVKVGAIVAKVIVK